MLRQTKLHYLSKTTKPDTAMPIHSTVEWSELASMQYAVDAGAVKAELHLITDQSAQSKPLPGACSNCEDFMAKGTCQICEHAIKR